MADLGRAIAPLLRKQAAFLLSVAYILCSRHVISYTVQVCGQWRICGPELAPARNCNLSRLKVALVGTVSGPEAAGPPAMRLAISKVVSGRIRRSHPVRRCLLALSFTAPWSAPTDRRRRYPSWGSV